MRLRFVLPLLLLTACGSTTAGGAAAPDPSSAATDDSLAAGGDIQRAGNDLAVQVNRGDGSPADSWTLTCAGVVEGSHSEARATCAHLTSLDAPFAPLPADVLCTQVYGGPQTAQVTGVWGGQPVDLQLSRSDGCRIAQWDGLVPLVPAAS